MENCPLDKLSKSATEKMVIEVCERCMEEDGCVFNGVEDVPFRFDEAYVKCKKCKDMATLWLENGEVPEVKQEIIIKNKSTKSGMRHERIYKPAGKYYSKDGEIYHRCYNEDSLCEVMNIQKGERP